MFDSNAYRAFELSCKRIEGLVRCADITAIIAIASLRNEEPNSSLLKDLMKEQVHSQLTWSWRFYISPSEYEMFKKELYIRAACEQIVFASYVAIEEYLKNKFAEYFHAKYSAPTPAQQQILLQEISLRNLNEIGHRFKTYFGAHISNYDPDIAVFAEADWFHPTTTWGGLKRLENFRHELAHEGGFASAHLVALVDAWSVFEFVSRYGQCFESSFNNFIYRNVPVKYGEN